MASPWASVEQLGWTLCLFAAVTAIRLCVRLLFHLNQWYKAEKYTIGQTRSLIWQMWAWHHTRTLLLNCVYVIAGDCWSISVIVVDGVRVFVIVQWQVFLWILFPDPLVELPAANGNTEAYLWTSLKHDLSVLWNAL